MEPARPVPPFTISDTITYSWNATFRNFGPLMLVSLVVFIGNVFAILIGEATSTPGLELAFNLIAIVVDLLLVLGLIRASLDVVQGRRPSAGEVFRPEGAGPYLVASILYLVGVYVGLILVVPGVVFGVIFQFYGYVVAEHPTVGALTALGRSAAITKGVRLRLVGLALGARAPERRRRLGVRGRARRHLRHHRHRARVHVPNPHRPAGHLTLTKIRLAESAFDP